MIMPLCFKRRTRDNLQMWWNYLKTYS